jgi:DNA-binding NarL/FixJ family response regulator
MELTLPNRIQRDYSRIPSLVIALPDRMFAEMISEWQFNCSFRTLATLETGFQIISRIRTLNPDFLFIDSELPHFNGFELAEKLKIMNFSTKIIMYASKKTPDYLSKFMDGSNQIIRGFIHTGCGVDELERCMIEVFSGKKYMSSCLTEYLNEMEELPTEEKQIKIALGKLSKKEKDVLVLIAKGNSETEIAHKLSVGVNTIRTYKYRITEKLNLANTKQKLTYWASSMKIFIIKYCL